MFWDPEDRKPSRIKCPSGPIEMGQNLIHDSSVILTM